MNDQLQLFDLPASIEARGMDRLSERRRKQKLCFNATSERWRTTYETFILDYAEMHETFIAESVRKSYELRKDLPQLIGSDYRASGQIFMALVKQGKLKRVGYGDSIDRSSPMPRYSK